MKRTRGFTLVEVMILLLIIALMLVMIIPAWMKIQQAKQEHNAVADPTVAPVKP